jgi:hypothetical protein
VLLEGENKGNIFSFVDANGGGCLSKRGGVRIRMASKAWMRHDALHAVEEGRLLSLSMMGCNL